MRRTRYKRGAPSRPLTSDDVADWMSSAEARPDDSIRGMEKLLNSKNRVRLWRLRSDYKWVRKQLMKAGINPERARELL